MIYIKSRQKKGVYSNLSKDFKMITMYYYFSSISLLESLNFLKVRQSRKQIMVSSILPKNERWDNFQYIKLPQRSFFGRIEDTINCFPDLLTFRNSSKYMTVEFRNGHTVPLLAGKMVQDQHGTEENFRQYSIPTTAVVDNLLLIRKIGF